MEGYPVYSYIPATTRDEREVRGLGTMGRSVPTPVTVTVTVFAVGEEQQGCPDGRAQVRRRHLCPKTSWGNPVCAGGFPVRNA